MNKVLPWVKSNWLIVVLSVLIIAILPTALIISSGMNKALRDEVQSGAKADENELRNFNLTYTIESPVPGVPDVEYKGVANRETIEWFKQQREAIQTEATQVWTRALAFNRAEHGVLMPGIFPEPAPGTDDLVLRADFTRLVVDNAAKNIMTTMKAGAPPDGAKLAADIIEYAQDRAEQILAQSGNSALTPEEGTALQKELSQMRTAEYQGRAEGISVYALPTAFEDIPDFMPENIVSIRFCWERWQEPIWALQDFAAAVATANTAIPGREKGVPGSVVKRILRVDVREPSRADQSAADDGFNSVGSAGGGAADYSTPVPLNPAVSLTGRISGRGTNNNLYDVRLIEAEVIISTRHIPVFLNALAATNFMTVLDLDLERVDLMEHLGQGYVYGANEHVVKAKLLIETIWFREWVAPLMPPDVRTARGIELPAADGADGQEPDPGQG